MKNKKEISYEKSWIKLKWISLSKRSQSEKGYILPDSNYHDILERQKYRDSKKHWLLPEDRREEGMKV